MRTGTANSIWLRCRPPGMTNKNGIGRIVPALAKTQERNPKLKRCTQKIPKASHPPHTSEGLQHDPVEIFPSTPLNNGCNLGSVIVCRKFGFTGPTMQSAATPLQACRRLWSRVICLRPDGPELPRCWDTTLTTHGSGAPLTGYHNAGFFRPWLRVARV
jgi:hypothetical protein